MNGSDAAMLDEMDCHCLAWVPGLSLGRVSTRRGALELGAFSGRSMEGQRTVSLLLRTIKSE